MSYLPDDGKSLRELAVAYGDWLEDSADTGIGLRDQCGGCRLGGPSVHDASAVHVRSAGADQRRAGTNDVIETIGGRPPMSLEAFIEKHRKAFE